MSAAVSQLISAIQREENADRVERMQKIFEDKEELSDLLYAGSAAALDTREVANKLQSYEGRVNNACRVQDVQNAVVTGIEDTGDTRWEMPPIEDADRSPVSMRLQGAQGIISAVYEQIVRSNPLAAAVPAVQRLQVLGKSMTDIMRELDRLPLDGGSDCERE